MSTRDLPTQITDEIRSIAKEEIANAIEARFCRTKEREAPSRREPELIEIDCSSRPRFAPPTSVGAEEQPLPSNGILNHGPNQYGTQLLMTAPIKPQPLKKLAKHETETFTQVFKMARQFIPNLKPKMYIYLPAKAEVEASVDVEDDDAVLQFLENRLTQLNSYMLKHPLATFREKVSWSKKKSSTVELLAEFFGKTLALYSKLGGDTLNRSLKRQMARIVVAELPKEFALTKDSLVEQEQLYDLRHLQAECIARLKMIPRQATGALLTRRVAEEDEGLESDGQVVREQDFSELRESLSGIKRAIEEMKQASSAPTSKFASKRDQNGMPPKYCIKLKKRLEDTAEVEIEAKRANGSYGIIKSGVLDSGCWFNVASQKVIDGYKTKPLNLNQRKMFENPAGEKLEASRLVMMELRVKLGDGRVDLKECMVFIIKSQKWNKLLVGDNTMRNHKISPKNAVGQRWSLQCGFDRRSAGISSTT